MCRKPLLLQNKRHLLLHEAYSCSLSYSEIGLKSAVMSVPEEELTCPVCCEIFTDPVLLSCSHSFCRKCLKLCWDSGRKDCPVCRKRTPKSKPPSNLALKNICEALQEVKRRNSEQLKAKMMCDQHGETFKLFCVVDEQPLCVVCHASKLHKTHECLPVEEALQDRKDKLAASLRSFQDKLKVLERNHRTCVEMFQHVKNQSLETEKVIKKQFEELHRALRDEETSRLASVRREEEQKMTTMKIKMKKISAEVLSTSEVIAALQKQLRESDRVLLRTFKESQNRCDDSSLPDMSGLLFDVSKHLSNLKFRVWEKLSSCVESTPVTFDPNTAHPCLLLSEDLTSLRYNKHPACCPDNPERFHISAEVVGTPALDSARHHWVVDTGSNPDWLLGLVSASAPRNAEVSARPENGFWTLCLRDGKMRAMTSPPAFLTLPKIPQCVKVELDYQQGELRFTDYADDTLIYTFKETFTEVLFPYFYTQSSEVLKILPEKTIIKRGTS